MYTKRTSIIIKRIVVVLSSILLVGIIYTKIRDETHSCMGVPIIAEELLQGKLKQEKEIGNIISLKQKMLPYDKENSRIYIPCTVDEETKIYDFQGKLESSLSEYKLYFPEDSIFNIISEAVKYSYEFQLYAVNADGEYKIYHVIFTTLPVLEMHGEILATDERGRDIYFGKMTFWAPQEETHSIYVQESNLEWHDRGFSSMSFAKRSQKISLKEAIGNNQQLSLAGLSEDDDYILNPMWFDDVKVREKLAMDLWNEIAEKENSTLKMTGGEYCELVINESYQGLRLLQNRLEKKYLNLDEEDILLKGMNVNVGAGECPEDVYEIVYAKDHEEAYRLMDDFFYETDFQQLDLENWIDIQLFLQLGNMIDNHYYKNIYYVLMREEKEEALHLIPWDTDMSFGVYWNDGFSYMPESVETISYRMEYSSLKKQYPQIPEKLAKRWRELREGVFSEANIINKIEEYESLILKSGALGRDYNVLGWNSWGGEDNIDNLKSYIERRLEVLDENYGLH